MTNKLDSLQVLRALAAFAVVFSHIPMIDRGEFGVDIFFVVSGFIICYITERDSSHFIVKRIFRVLPLYYVGTLGIFFIGTYFPALVSSEPGQVTELIKSLLFIPYHNAGGEVAPVLKLGWTLNYEMFFYVVFALSLQLSKVHASAICAGILALLISAGQLFDANNLFYQFYTDTILLEFIYGMAIYTLWKNTNHIDVNKSLEYLALGLALTLVCLMFFIDRGGIRFLSFGVPAVAVVSLMLWGVRSIKFPFWLVLLGDASYSLYLFHPYLVLGVDRLIFNMHSLTIGSALVAAAVVVACGVLSIISFYILEKRSNQWLRNRFIPRRPRPRLATSQPTTSQGLNPILPGKPMSRAYNPSLRK
ncbi:acyltransferase family protein [Thalassotalea mangrovi]|uniref:Acyltransferase n=1 Tax=Thalassotalea mangrovi TaxID=2572245 RepID=A0A4U1B273_9GAMM|nr:acyltransferase [Thalassotalea mangrovi]TKB43198.1 acyltransferase [Thalassotalea mangrovi]